MITAARTFAFLLMVESVSVIASVPPLYSPGHVPNQPSGGVILGPIHPRSAVVQASDFSLYDLLPAPSNSSLFNQPIVEGDLFAEAIFLGRRWQSPAFSGDKVGGLDEFLSGWNGSRYATTLLEYAFEGDATHPPAPMQLQYLGHMIDPVPERSMQSGVERLAVNEICDGIASGNIQAARGSNVAPVVPEVPRNVFLVYTSTRRSKGGACAVHGWHQCPDAQGGVLFDYAIVYDTDGDPECDPGRSLEANHSEGLAATANSTARAIAEIFTDPFWYGWMDLLGNEVADKCPWQFDRPYVTFSNGSRWRLQSLWSNAAFLSGLGSQNFEGKPGCVEEGYWHGAK